MTTILPAGDIAEVWSTAGSSSVTRHPPGVIGYNFNTSGAPGGIKNPLGNVGWSFGTAGAPQKVEVLTGAGFEIRVYDRASPNTNPIAVLPRIASVKFEDVLRGVGSAEVALVTPKGDDIAASVFSKNHVWKVLWEGQERFAFRAEFIEDVTVRADEHHQRKIVGRGVAQDMEGAATYPLGINSQSPISKRTFTNISRASIALQLMNEAQARGAITQVSRNTWTGLIDSNGAAWADVNTLVVEAGTSLLQLIQNYSDITWDWHVDSKFALSLAPKIGRDVSRQVVLHPATAIVEQTITSDRGSLANVVVVEDMNGGVTEQTDAASVAFWGRIEQYAKAVDTIDQSSRANVGYSLLQLWKNERVERRVKVSTKIPGRKPFIDFDIGDTVGVEFTDGTTLKSRVIAIAMSGSEQAAEECEVTLDFMLEQRSRNGGANETSGVGSSDSQQLIFGDNGASPLTITTSQQIVVTLSVQAFISTYAKVSGFLRGISSVAQRITVDFMFNGAVIRTVTQEFAAGHNLINPTFVVSSIPAGTNSAWLRVSVSAGTFAIAGFDAQYWFEGKNLNGGIGGVSPQITVADSISAYQAISDQKVLALQTPLAIGVADSVNAYQTITDSINLDAIYTPVIGVSEDDGHTSDIPSFSALANYVSVGNDAGQKFSGFYRFSLGGLNLTGKTITGVFLGGIGDQNDTGALTVISASKEGTATAPTSRADYLARVRTTANVNWDTNVTSGVALRSPDLKAIIQELVAAYGATLTTILILHEDRSSPLNSKMFIRSKDNAAAPTPSLEIRYH